MTKADLIDEVSRIVELTPKGVVNFSGSYDDYLLSQSMESKPASSSRKQAR